MDGAMSGGRATRITLALGWPFARAALVLWAVSLITFVLIHLAGDPASVLLPVDTTPEARAAFRHAWSLDQSLPVQYFEYLAHAVQGDFGTSWRYHTGALGVVVDRLPATLLLVVATLVIAWMLGAPAGLVAAIRERGMAHGVLVHGAMVLQAVPGFWIGILLILVFAVELKVLPVAGGGSINNLILPAVALAAAYVGEVMLVTRTTVVETLSAGFVRTALAKGVSPWRIYGRHAIPNASLPLIGTLGIQFSTLIGGSVIIETVFSWPGVGLLLVTSVQTNDFPVVLASAFCLSFVVVIASMTTELLQGLIDPRLRR
jgi:peptide/nickel transport system permease protein